MKYHSYTLERLRQIHRRAYLRRYLAARSTNHPNNRSVIEHVVSNLLNDKLHPVNTEQYLDVLSDHGSSHILIQILI